MAVRFVDPTILVERIPATWGPANFTPGEVIYERATAPTTAVVAPTSNVTTAWLGGEADYGFLPSRASGYVTASAPSYATLAGAAHQSAAHTTTVRIPAPQPVPVPAQQQPAPAVAESCQGCHQLSQYLQEAEKENEDALTALEEAREALERQQDIKIDFEQKIAQTRRKLMELRGERELLGASPRGRWL